MLHKNLIKELEAYIERHQSIFTVYQVSEFENNDYTSEIEMFIDEKRKPTFHQVLFSFIDQTDATDPEIYHRAGLDRKHFSKIRSNSNYRPRKNTIVALALALELDLEETETLLHAAGYSLSESDTYDLVLQFCIEKKIYNIFDVNVALENFGLHPLIG